MSRPDEVIDLTSDNDETASGSGDEDEDLKRAIAISLQEYQYSKQILKTDLSKESLQAISSQGRTETNSDTRSAEAEVPEKSSNIMVALDRKQMEAERLDRLKRKRGEATIVDRTISPPPLQRVIRPLPLRSDATVNVSRGRPKNSPLPYAGGKIFLTSAGRSHQGPNAISMPDLLRPPDATFSCKSVLLSTFISDFDWLFSHFATRSVSFMLVLHAASPEHKQLLAEDFAGIPNVRLVFPRVGGLINCMHSKLMLLFYEKDGGHGSACRLVVPTANLTPADWGVQGVMENTVFVIDLPQADNKDAKTGIFKENLVQLLRTQQVPESVITKLNDFDFSDTKIGFIHTIGGAHMLPPQLPKVSISNFFANPAGTHTATDLPPDQFRSPSSRKVSMPTPPSTRTGLHNLSDTINSLGLSIPPSSPLPKLDYITSSLGNLKTPFIQTLFLACCGRAPESPIYSNSSSNLRSKSKSNSKTSSSATATSTPTLSPPTKHQIKSNLRIYFPSDHTVRSSKGGPNAAGTICFQSKWWDADSDFPKSSLRDCVGVRGDGMLMHSKILYARFSQPRSMASGEDNGGSSSTALGEGHDDTDTDTDTDTSVDVRKYYSGWACIGSANLSESAWGTIVADSTSRQPKLNCRNWESGVLIPIPVTSSVQQLLDAGRRLHDMTLREVFGGVVPVPVQEPAETYEDGRRPWFFNG